MKAVLAILIIAVVSFALAGDILPRQSIPPLPTGSAVGRFQLVSATVDDTAGQPTHRYIFRIDTATGRVWRYEHVGVAIEVTDHPEMKTTDAEGWVATEEDFNQSFERAQSFGKTFGQPKPKPEPAK